MGSFLPFNAGFSGMIRSSAWKTEHQLGLKIVVGLFFVGRTDKVEVMVVLRQF